MEINIVEKLLNMTLIGAEWVLWLLIILSIISVGIILERIFYFFMIGINFSEFSNRVTKDMAKGNFEDILSECENSQALEKKVLVAGLKRIDEPSSLVEGVMEGKIVSEKQKMDKGLVILGTLGNNAPFIGLFGTVIGIIKAFNDLSLNPEGGPSVVMSGISEALVATAVGLMVAIPAVIAYNFFNRIIKVHVANAQSLIKLVVTQKK